MKHFVRKHKRKILAGHGIAVFTLLATSAMSLYDGQAILFFTPASTSTLEIGESTDVEININAKVPINALGATVKFPPELIEIEGISKKDSFLDLWTEETTIKEETGEVYFSGGTLRKGGLTGTSTALTLTVRAKKPGEAKIYFENVQVLASDGKGMAVNSALRSYTYSIPEPPKTAAPQGTAETTSEQTDVSSVDFNNDGKVTIVDVSILMFQVLGTYDARYDLDQSGTLGLSDLSILFSKM